MPSPSTQPRTVGPALAGAPAFLVVRSALVADPGPHTANTPYTHNMAIWAA
jgi:hypothetical protein